MFNDDAILSNAGSGMGFCPMTPLNNTLMLSILSFRLCSSAICSSFSVIANMVFVVEQKLFIAE
jgi:hypothetical protein